MPLYRRLPRRGFSHDALAVTYDVVNVGALAAFPDGATVTPADIEKAGLIRGTRGARMKVLGTGELKKPLSVSAHRFSTSAEQKIKAAGGTCIVIAIERKQKAAEAPAT